MIQSRITQTTIPAPVRKALGLKAGDLVSYHFEDGLTRAEVPADLRSPASRNGTAARTGSPMPTTDVAPARAEFAHRLDLACAVSPDA